MKASVISLILIILSLASIEVQLKLCAVDSDCNAGYKWQEIQEWDDFGCQQPIFECVPNDNFSSAYTIAASDYTPSPQTTSRVQTTQQGGGAARSTAAAGSNRPSRLTIRTQNTQPATLRFDSTTNQNAIFELSLNPSTGELSLSNTQRPVIRISHDGNLVDMSNGVTIQTYGLQVQNLWNFADTQLKYNGVPQWKLVYDEVFMVGQAAEGWSLPEATSRWGAMSLLGGYCRTSTQTLSKSFSGLPQHTRARIQANFHFIDSWGGDTAYMKVTETDDMHTMSYAWTDSFDYVSTRNAVNVWGRDIGEGKFNQFIDFEMLHSYETIKIMFGTSLEQDSWSASYGISSVRIYVI